MNNDIKIAKPTGKSIFKIKVAETAPTNPATEPTDKSILPQIKIHKSIPMAKIKT